MSRTAPCYNPTAMNIITGTALFVGGFVLGIVATVAFYAWLRNDGEDDDASENL